MTNRSNMPCLICGQRGHVAASCPLDKFQRAETRQLALLAPNAEVLRSNAGDHAAPVGGRVPPVQCDAWAFRGFARNAPEGGHILGDGK